MAAAPIEIIEVEGREVQISNPNKVFFPQLGITKRELVQCYLSVAGGALRGIRNGPMALKRFPNGADGEFFFQKRAPASRPEWVDTVELHLPAGRTADEVVVRNSAALAWVVNLGCIDLNPHPVRSEDLTHPDELRVDLDPTPGVPWKDIREVALCVREVLEAHHLVGFAKTSGSRGMHVNVRIEPRWDFQQVLRRALAPPVREAGRRAPAGATLPAPTKLQELAPRHRALKFLLQLRHPGLKLLQVLAKPGPEALEEAPILAREMVEGEHRLGLFDG